MKEFQTFSELSGSTQVKEGLRLVCRERANAEYILQADGYVALAGDVTFANARVGALQIKAEGMSVLSFGASFDSATCQP